MAYKHPNLYQVGPDWHYPGPKPSIIGLDTETSSLAVHSPNFKVFCISWAVENIDFVGGLVSLASELPAQVRNWIEDPEVLKCAHHAKYDAKVLATLGIVVRNFRCSRILWHDHDETSTDDPKAYSVISAGLQTLAIRMGLPYYEAPKDRWFELNPKASWEDFFNDAPEILLPYAAMDAWAHLQLYQHLLDTLPTPQLRRHYDFQSRAEQMLFEVESNGIHFDVVKATEALEEYDLKVRQKLHEILQLAPEIYSKKGKTGIGTKLLTKWLFEAQGAAVLGRTEKTREPKLDEDVLRRLTTHPQSNALVKEVVQKILDYRKLMVYPKMVRTILKGVVGDKIYPSFRMFGTRTGRLASGDSKNPESVNVQNIPRTGPLRKCFVSRFED